MQSHRTDRFIDKNAWHLVLDGGAGNQELVIHSREEGILLVSYSLALDRKDSHLGGVQFLNGNRFLIKLCAASTVVHRVVLSANSCRAGAVLARCWKHDL
jgi:hypothetical protein